MPVQLTLRSNAPLRLAATPSYAGGVTLSLQGAFAVRGAGPGGVVPGVVASGARIALTLPTLVVTYSPSRMLMMF